MNFANEIENVLNSINKQEYSQTENGAVAFKYAPKAILDMNYQLNSLRNASWKEIGDYFSKVFYEEDTSIAMKFFYWILDVREGAGERNISKGIMKWMVNNHSDILEKVYEHIPEYGRWDILILLADPKFNTNESFRLQVVNFIRNQFASDLKNLNSLNSNISLLGKWMPSENASSKETIRMARQLMHDLNIKPRTYRKALMLLRNHLNVVECNMSSNHWENINYEYVPSKANLNYSDAFMRHDEERRQKYLESLKAGNSKINAKVVAPYEIVKDYTGIYSVVNPRNETLEQMWEALPQYQLDNILVVRDGSGSMTDRIGNTKVTCLQVATSLAIYAAEHNKGIWKDKFITFSSKPQFVNLSKCSSLREKLEVCSRYDECSNTDIYKTMKLILNTAISNGCKQKDMPKSILIVSDMQFDSYGYYNKLEHGAFNYDKVLFESIKTEYMAAGYKLPKIIFWNVDERGNKTIPLQENELGLILCSGFSANIFKMVLGEEIDPYKQLLKILNSERYSFIDECLS